MATNINTDDVVSLRSAKVASVEKISKIEDAQVLPQSGKDLPKAEETSNQDIEKAVDLMNEQIQQVHRQLQFSIDKDLDRVVITVIDRDTEEVIRQIPNEEALSFAKRFAEGADLEIIDNFA